MLDCVIIGTGAAGISAALTLKLLKRQFIILGSVNLSEKITRAEKIKNYPGLCAVSGADMCKALMSQLKEEQIEITPATVNGVYPEDGGYSVMCADKSYGAKTVILATGTERVKPVSGEREFLGRGVSYCATCDGFLYRGKTVAAALESEAHLQEAELLKKYAQTVHILSLNGDIAGSIGCLTGVEGESRVTAVLCGDKKIPVDGVFILKDAVAANALVHGLKMQGGAVEVGRDMSTNLKGIFAAGDITGKPYQYAKAVGEGNVAAHSVNAYLSQT